MAAFFPIPLLTGFNTPGPKSELDEPFIYLGKSVGIGVNTLGLNVPCSTYSFEYTYHESIIKESKLQYVASLTP